MDEYFYNLFTDPTSPFSPPFPDCYLIFDTETNGVDPRANCITQFGMCVVTNGVITSRTSCLLQLDPGVRIPTDLEQKIGITNEMCQSQGANRDEAFACIFDLVTKFVSAGCAICGHNLFSFDLEFLRHEAFRRGFSLHVPDTQVWDTGMMVKAMGMNFRPFPGHSRGDFYREISGSYSRVKWNLEYCSNLFNLENDPSLQNLGYHDALFDCVKCYQILNYIRNSVNRGIANAAVHHQCPPQSSEGLSAMAPGSETRWTSP